MQTSLSSYIREGILGRLHEVNTELSVRYPGDGPRRQPVHTVYGGAHLFRADTARKLGDLALRSLEEYAPDAQSLVDAVGFTEDRRLAETVYARIVDKLRREPIEDFRVDFEDGFGQRSDDEEDAHAVAVAEQVARGQAAGLLPPFVGIRIKPFTEELRDRSVRTLDLFLTALVSSGGPVPPNLLVTLPKVTHPEHVAALADLLDAIEPVLSLPHRSVGCEVMVETPQAIFAGDGVVQLPRLVTAGRGRVVSAHFGTYDYTALLQVTAAHQHMRHPACDFAKHVMQVTLAGTGVWLSDGATTVLPIGPHRAAKGGSLTALQQQENRAAVHRAWRLHHDNVRHSLITAFYQGWDLHPAQLPPRYAAVYTFFLEGLQRAAERLRNFIVQAAQATLIGGFFDDAATGQGLLNYFLRAISCGAVTEDEATTLTGLTPDELRTRSFPRILAMRQARQGM